MPAEEIIETIYKKIALLYKKGNKDIWWIENRQNHKQLILKIIRRTGLPYSHLKGIQHTGLPIIYDVYTTENTTYVIEEYMNGMTLQEYVSANGLISEEEVKKIAVQLCNILEVLHKSNIIHRDIKPSNIFLTETDSIKLIDFDAARIYKENQEHDTRYLGTEKYAAPEQYGSSTSDCRTDIFLLGKTMEQLLGNNHSDEIFAIMKHCQEYDAQYRFQNASALKNALQNGYIPEPKQTTILHFYKTKQKIAYWLAYDLFLTFIVLFLYASINYVYETYFPASFSDKPLTKLVVSILILPMLSYYLVKWQEHTALKVKSKRFGIRLIVFAIISYFLFSMLLYFTIQFVIAWQRLVNNLTAQMVLVLTSLGLPIILTPLILKLWIHHIKLQPN